MGIPATNSATKRGDGLTKFKPYAKMSEIKTLSDLRQDERNANVLYYDACRQLLFTL